MLMATSLGVKWQPWSEIGRFRGVQAVVNGQEFAITICGFHFSQKDTSPQSIQLVPMADQIAGSDGNLSNWSEGPKAGAGKRMRIT
jgi:hypothetical protein